MKGVSPVVATVLLIAITVIAAVGVWYYTENLMNENTDSMGSMQKIDVNSCIVPTTGNAALWVKNMNAELVDNVVFTVYYQANRSDVNGSTFSVSLKAKQGAVNTSITSTKPLVKNVQYIAIADGFSDVVFTCS